jgi:hypothetical protein
MYKKFTSPKFWFIAGAVFLFLDPVFDHTFAAMFSYLPYVYKDAGRLFFLVGGVLFILIGYALLLKRKFGIKSKQAIR